MMSLNDFNKKYNLKNKPTSTIKLYEVLKKDRTAIESGNLSESWKFSNKV